MTTTATKKHIIDFLWEWAEKNGDWAKMLVEQIALTECDLNEETISEIFDYYLQSLGLKSGLPTKKITAPVFQAKSMSIFLTSLQQVEGVNKLAASQQLEFSKNITVIYGENGSGKTGYARILKSLGISYALASVVLPNVYASNVPQSAQIQYERNGQPHSFMWNGKVRSSELATISVFTNDCVKISLADNRQLIVTPPGFQLFNIVTKTLASLEEKLNTTITSYACSLDFLHLLHAINPQHAYAQGISARSPVKTLEDLSVFNTEHASALTALDQQLKDLNPSLLGNEIKSLRLCIGELQTLAGQLQVDSALIGQTTLDQLDTLKSAIAKLEKKGEASLTSLIADKHIDQGDSKEFFNFLVSAEQYIKKLDREYPQEADDCLYCRQQLSGEARELLNNYRLLLNDTTKEELAKLTNERNQLVKWVNDKACSYVLHQPAFGLSQEGTLPQPQQLEQLKENVEQFKKEVNDKSALEKLMVGFSFEPVITLLNTRRDELAATLQKKETTLNNITAKETELSKQIDELLDRRLFSEKKDQIKTIITNNQTVGALQAGRAKLNSKAISNKTSQAREALVKDNFNELFKKELEAFGKGHIKIDLDFGTQKGQSQVRQKICSMALSDILSEGEQKAIALSQFLTELQIDHVQAPVVFDDPVNSLDHNILDNVSRRLVKLSQDRQVIVFTHSILLFNSIIQKLELPSNKQTFKYYETHTDLQHTGILHETFDGKTETFRFYEKQINALLNTSAAARTKTENEMAVEGYGKLRSAIEVFIEDDVLNSLVRRYKRNVSMTAFPKVNGTAIDDCKEEVNEIFERCCGYIDGHSNPEELNRQPTLSELEQDLKAMQEIKKSFPKN